MKTTPNVPAVQLPKTGGGTATFTDITDTTAIASDVISGKYFYLASGQKVQGSRTGGISLSQDANGYVVLPNTGDAQIFKAKTVTQSGTYNASSDGADGYSSVIVNAGTVNVDAVTSTELTWTITFTGLVAEPKAFFVCHNPNASSMHSDIYVQDYRAIVTVLYNGSSTEAYGASGTSASASVSKPSGSISFTYSSGTLAITYTRKGTSDTTRFYTDYELTYIY